jgi:hypothetical protein
MLVPSAVALAILAVSSAIVTTKTEGTDFVGGWMHICAQPRAAVPTHARHLVRAREVLVYLLSTRVSCTVHQPSTNHF